MAKIKKNFFLLVMAACLVWGPRLSAEEKLTIGVAANFMAPFKEIAHEFESRTAVKIDAAYTSTGSLYGQIINGAPYDLFLAADENRPERLEKEGLSSDSFVYARGRVVLWTAKKRICNAENWEKALKMKGVSRIAIPNPETAPYGTAAITALESAGLKDLTQKKLVFAQNVVQAFQYAHTETADAGFCALSSAITKKGKKGCYFFIGQAPIIIQKACILNRSTKRRSVEKFAAFLCSPEAEAVKKRYGYE